MQSLQWSYGIDSPRYCPQNCHIMDPFDETSLFFRSEQHSISAGNWLRCIHKIVSSRRRPDMFLMDQPLLHCCSARLPLFKGFLWKTLFPFSLCLCLTSGAPQCHFLSSAFLKDKIIKTIDVACKSICSWVFVVLTKPPKGKYIFVGPLLNCLLLRLPGRNVFVLYFCIWSFDFVFWSNRFCLYFRIDKFGK